MNILLSSVLPFALMIGCFVVPIYVLMWLRKLQRQNRRSPLSAKLLRGPGETLRRELDNIGVDLSAYLAVLMTLPILVFSIHISQSYFVGSPETVTRWLCSTVKNLRGQTTKEMVPRHSGNTICGVQRVKRHLSALRLGHGAQDSSPGREGRQIVLRLPDVSEVPRDAAGVIFDFRVLTT